MKMQNEQQEHQNNQMNYGNGQRMSYQQKDYHGNQQNIHHTQNQQKAASNFNQRHHSLPPVNNIQMSYHQIGTQLSPPKIHSNSINSPQHQTFNTFGSGSAQDHYYQSQTSQMPSLNQMNGGLSGKHNLASHNTFSLNDQFGSRNHKHHSHQNRNLPGTFDYINQNSQNFVGGNSFRNQGHGNNQ
jgi:hypothetical protein